MQTGISRKLSFRVIWTMLNEQILKRKKKSIWNVLWICISCQNANVRTAFCPSQSLCIQRQLVFLHAFCVHDPQAGKQKLVDFFFYEIVSQIVLLCRSCARWAVVLQTIVMYICAKFLHKLQWLEWAGGFFFLLLKEKKMQRHTFQKVFLIALHFSKENGL